MLGHRFLCLWELTRAKKEGRNALGQFAWASWLVCTPNMNIIGLLGLLILAGTYSPELVFTFLWYWWNVCSMHHRGLIRRLESQAYQVQESGHLRYTWKSLRDVIRGRKRHEENPYKTNTSTQDYVVLTLLYYDSSCFFHRLLSNCKVLRF